MKMAWGGGGGADFFEKGGVELRVTLKKQNVRTQTEEAFYFRNGRRREP